MKPRSDLTRRALLSFRLREASAPSPTAAASEFALSSYALACAQVNEARPFLADEARRYGIDTENRSELDILRDVFAKAHLPAV
jgi:hypothetical protein